ncbi:kinase-like protein [Rhizophagus irregularis]|uniref:Kinase-like protein n=1 Tax=Rhizophagus irregularis TaxID=588596 RepID=A0A2N0RHZ7_9GLOM|nr:kinase-like protein [Rhizophagus irregularis]
MDQFISENKLKWVPYNKFEEVEYLDKGGFGTIYKATYKKYKVILKYFDYLNNSDESLNEFLNEWKIINSNGIIRVYGFTKDPDTSNYMVIMQYANRGNLRGCLIEIANNWQQKLYTLHKIVMGLNTIHKNGLIHYNFHDGNILCEYNGSKYEIYISDYLGSYQLAKSFLKKDNIYGIIPFMAPEVLRGKPYSQASDIFSFSIIMWEFTSGILPFNDKAHDFQLALSICKGERPEIIENTPQCYVDLMKKCWDEDPSKRPSASYILNIIKKWITRSVVINEELKSNIMEFINAPIKHNNQIVESHPQVCYTSHLLDFTSEELNESLEGFQGLKFLELKQKDDDAEQELPKLEVIAETNYQSSIQMELAKLQQRNSQFKQENQALTDNLTEQTKQISKLNHEKINLQNQLSQIEANIRELKSQQDKSQSNYKKIEEENLKLENELVDSQQRNFKFEQNNQNLRFNLAVQIKEFAEKEDILQTQIINLQNEKQSLAGNLAEQLKQNKLTKKQVQIQIIQLEQEKVDLQGRLTQTEVEIQELKSHKENLIEQKEQLANRLNQFQDNYEQIEQESNRLQNVVRDLSQVTKLKANFTD